MLAQVGCEHDGWREGEFRAGKGVPRANEVRYHVRVFHHVGHRLDPRDGHANRSEKGHEFFARARAGDFGDFAVELLLGRNPAGVAPVFFPRQVLEAGKLRYSFPLLVTAHSQVDITVVGCGVDGDGREEGVGVAAPVDYLPKRAGHHYGDDHPGDGAAEHGDVNSAPLPRNGPAVEGFHHLAVCVFGCPQVHHRQAEDLRGAVRLACQVHEAGMGLEDGVVGRLVDLGPVARDAHPDDVRPELAQSFVVNAQLGVIFGQGVAGEDVHRQAHNQFVQDCAPLFAGQVEGNGLLAGVVGQVIRVHALLAQHVFPHVAVGVRPTRVFQPDDPRAFQHQPVGEEGQAEGLFQAQHGQVAK